MSKRRTEFGLDEGRHKRKRRSQSEIGRHCDLVQQYESAGMPRASAIKLVAKEENVKLDTLQASLRANAGNSNHKNARYLLNPAQEEVLCAWLCYAAYCGVDLTLGYVRTYGERLLKVDGRKFTSSWYKRFKQRHSDKLQKAKGGKPLPDSRKNENHPANFRKFAEVFADINEHLLVTARSLLNVDATDIGAKAKIHNHWKLELSQAACGWSAGFRGVHLGTALTAANPDVGCLLVAYVFKDEKASMEPVFTTFPGDFEEAYNVGWKRVYLCTKTGAYDSYIFEMFLQELIVAIGERYGCGKEGTLTRHSLVLHDNASAHLMSSGRFAKALELNAKKGLHTMILPVHSTHFQQPLDQSPFAAVKSIFRSMVHTRQGDDRMFNGTTTDINYLKMWFEAEKRAYTKKNFEAAFEITKFWPLDLPGIVARGDVYYNGTLLEELKSNFGDEGRKVIENADKERQAILAEKGVSRKRGASGRSIFTMEELIDQSRRISDEGKLYPERAPATKKDTNLVISRLKPSRTNCSGCDEVDNVEGKGWVQCGYCASQYCSVNLCPQCRKIASMVESFNNHEEMCKVDHIVRGRKERCYDDEVDVELSSHEDDGISENGARGLK